MKKNIKKILGVLIVGAYVFSLFAPPLRVLANGETNPILQINGVSSLSDTNYLEFKDEENNIMGRLCVKYQNEGDCLTPTLNENEAIFNLNAVLEDSYSVSINVEVLDGYEIPRNSEGMSGYYLDGQFYALPGDNTVYINQVQNQMYNFNIEFIKQNNNHGPNGPGFLEYLQYPIFGIFSGFDEHQQMDTNGNIIAPDGWELGTVQFYAKVCKKGNEIRPYNDECEDGFIEDTNYELYTVGIQNNANGTVTSIPGNAMFNFSDNFKNYGKASFHLSDKDSIMTPPEEETPLNFVGPSVLLSNYIGLDTMAKYSMEFSLFSDYSSRATLTNANEATIYTFFGNDEITLIPEGKNVVKISKVTGAKSVEYVDNEAILELPSLSIETTTTVQVEFELNDETKITKTINIARTALLLDYNNAEGKNVYADYIVNKGYLYDNKSHDESGFDAYLQVILYKNDVVAGFKQIQINDKELVDSLEADESMSTEIFDDGKFRIPVYGKITDDLIEGVNKVSVFLTNGPIKFSDDKLPSIEFGVGSGVTLEWKE